MNNEKFLKYCIKNLDFDIPDLLEDYYSSVSLCAMDSIFSINTKYEAVKNAISNFCEYFQLKKGYPKKGEIPPIKKQISVSEICTLINNIDVDVLASEVFKNRQRTSPTNGILKADAALRFIKIISDFGIEYYQDIPKLILNETFEDCIKRIPGQKSGISLKYFFMLTGSNDIIKPDRMILGFIQDAIGVKVTPSEALSLIKYSVIALKKMGYENLNERHLDNLIWSYQRAK